MADKKDNIQGDLFNRGFPKFNETYYFFQIVPEKKVDFTKALNTLGTSKHIATINSVLQDWGKIDQKPKEPIPVANALIAFSMAGLTMIEQGLGGKNALSLNNVPTSDPAFAVGLAGNQTFLNDPKQGDWEAPFNGKSGPIHGLLKVAGDSKESVDAKLNAIKLILGNTIKDVAAQASPTPFSSRVDGQVRPRAQGLNGHEHFGFEDGISQPLLDDINSKEDLLADSAMRTEQNVITVTGKPPDKQPTLGANVDFKKRPDWMLDGSFLVFRKLAQDVQGFIDLTNKFASAGCTNADQFGAKLMGRWKSGAPVSLFPTQADGAKSDPIVNNFTFTNNNVCPLAAHIRKTNPRDSKSFTQLARIVRNGIPYGTEFSVDPKGDRGLLFACYQSSIDNGYQFIQKRWINDPNFPFGKDRPGFDAFTAQPDNNTLLDVAMFGTDQTPLQSFGKFNKLVTMKGGEYFFVPSISALTSTLGKADTSGTPKL